MKKELEKLNEVINLDENKLIFIGGRPATGKSSLGIALANNIVSKDKSVILFNLETLEETIRKNNKMNENVTIIDKPNISVEEIKTKFKMQDNLKLVIIDYLQLMQNDINICEKLQELSKELQINIIVLSQLTKAIEEREDKTPLITDLKIDVTNNFDVICFLTNNREFIVAKNGDVIK